MNIFAAVADPARRSILEQLAHGEQPATSLGVDLEMTQPAVARHLRVLREAGLVETFRVPEDGRLRLYRLRPEPLAELQSWLGQFWQSQLDAFAAYVEGRP